jgi:putative transposase
VKLTASISRCGVPHITLFIRTEKPIENAFAESFNGRHRGECLNENWIAYLPESPRQIGAWRLEYNEVPSS